MKWRGRQRSTNVRDVRGARPQRAGGLRLGGGKIGGLGLIVVVAIVYFSGGDLGQVLGVLVGNEGSSAGQHSTQAPQPSSRASDEAAEFVSIVLYDTETTWQNLLAGSRTPYRVPELTLFSSAVQSACGFASAASGPFYCPGDRMIYLDTSFFDDLARLGAPGDFAQAYVIAHEVGHHIQNLSGTLTEVRRAQQRASKEQGNALQVLVELQADCLAGVWANRAQTQRDLLESGDVEEGLRAAAAIGDDRLQKNAGRRVQPESFTHGSSAQRVEWFKRGMAKGNVSDCDTFAAANTQL